jgi:hypothetical protein
MTEQITLEEALQLVTFEQTYDGQWFILNVCGNVGNIDGNVCGNVNGNVWGSVKGNVDGTIRGTINGKEWTYVVETPKHRLKRLIEEGAATEKLIKAFNRLEEN